MSGVTGWGQGLAGAKAWAEQVAKDPAFAKQVIDAMQKKGFTKELTGIWSRFYDESFKGRGLDAPEQFRYRAEGLQRLYDQFPESESTAPTTPGRVPPIPLSPCPGPLCGVDAALEA